jgi:hypothetical protein
MANEPDNLVLQLLRGIRADMATKSELTELRAELNSLRADVASDLMAMQAKADAEHKATRDAVREQISGLRREVFEYHSSVVGHGVLISELDARVHRVEKHLELPPIDTN